MNGVIIAVFLLGVASTPIAIGLRETPRGLRQPSPAWRGWGIKRQGPPAFVVNRRARRQHSKDLRSRAAAAPQQTPPQRTSPTSSGGRKDCAFAAFGVMTDVFDLSRSPPKRSRTATHPGPRYGFTFANAPSDCDVRFDVSLGDNGWSRRSWRGARTARPSPLRPEEGQARARPCPHLRLANWWQKQNAEPKFSLDSASLNRDPIGNRTRDCAVRGRRPNR